MGLKEFYHSIEDAYYGLMDQLDRAGIPVYKIIDAIEAKNIPSFPFFLLFVIIVLCGLYFFVAVPMLGPSMNSFSLVVASDKGPIENAVVKLQVDDNITTYVTDDKGKVSLTITKGKGFQLTISKEGFEEKTQTFSANESGATITLKGQTKTVTVRLLKAGTSEIISQDVSVSFYCSGNSDYYKTETSSDGVIELADVPYDCGTITADSRELSCTDCSFDSSDSSSSIYLQEEEQGKGTVTLSVQDENLEPIAGIIARIIPNNGSTTEETRCTTTGTGACTASNVPFGEYYFTLTDSSEKYEFYDSSLKNNFITVNSSNTNAYLSTITLGEKVVGQIKVKIIDDSTKEAVNGAEVKLFKDGKELYTKNSGEDGIVVFNVSENVSYFLTVNHVDYLIPGPLAGIKPSDETREIELSRADSTNSQRIEVQVLDEKEEPVENAKVFLKDADRPSVIIGQMLVTGVDGRTQFERVKEGRYLVYAEKTGFKGKNSDEIVTVKPRQPASTIVNLTIGQGTIELKVLNEEQQGIQGATIKVMDYFTGTEIATELTDTQGEKTLTLRADKKVYLIASESTKADYTTTPIQLFQGAQSNTITMVDQSNAKNFKVLLNGIYGMDEQAVSEGQGETATVLDSGQSFKVKLQLILPNASYSSAGIHLRTGADTENQDNIMEQDDLYLKDITAPNARIIKGTSFNPSNGYSIDSQHLTSGNSKWANVIFSNPRAGVIEAEGVIQLRGSPASTQMNLAYRGWAVSGGTYLRDPYDSELKESESTATKQSLYAKAKYEPIRTGSSSLCTEKFCYWFRITDQSTGVQTTVSDSMPAEMSNSYQLEFNLISLSEQKFYEVSLSIANDSQGIEFKNFNIAGENKNLKASKILKPLGEISKGEKISGTIEFTTKKEGVNKIDFGLSAKTSLGTEKAFFKSIKIDVQAAGEFELQVVPAVLVSLIQNDIIVKAVDLLDGSPVSDATIKVMKNNNNLFSGTTNSDGIYSFSLEPMSTGTKVSITGNKIGFKEAEKELTTTEQVLLVSPESISESFNAAKDVTIKRDLILRNTTEVPLTVRAIEFSDDFRKMVNLNLSDGIIGQEMTSSVDYNTLLSMRMTPAGRNIEELTELNGKIIITLESIQIGRQWAQEIPLNITIGLGNEVDDPSCLSISPNEWSISIEGGKIKTKSFALANNCKVEGKPLELKRLQARIAWENGNETGTFTSKLEGSSLQLGTSWKQISGTLKPSRGDGTGIEIQFKADDISSGTGEPKIEFKAENRTQQGIEELSTSIKTSLNVSKLTECVQVIPTGQLRVELGPYNLGYGLYPQQFGYNPYQQAPYYYQQYNSFYPGTSYGGYGNNPNVVMYPEQLNQRYPYSYFSEPLTNSFYYDNQYNYAFLPPNSGRNNFRVQNNCSNTVQVSIEPDQALGVSKNTLTLEPGKDEQINVYSTLYAGNYGIIVRAQLKDSTEGKADITRIPVLVESEYFRDYRDCIFLNKRTFQFNDFIAKPDTGIIFNKCYDVGVRLNYDSIGITWGWNYSNTPGNTGSNQPSQQSISVTPGIIKDIRVLELLEKPGPDNKIIQQLEFEMIKDIEKSYRNDILEKFKAIDATKTPITEIGIYRAKITAGYYEVEAPANLSVKFINRVGASDSLNFNITIEDKWAALPLISEEINFGDPAITKFQSCINGDALNVKNYWAGRGNEGCLEENQFINDIYEHESDTKVMKIAKQGGCGSVDSLSQISPQTYTDSASGLKLTFQTVDGGHNIKLRVDKSNMTTQEATINTTIYANLTRMTPSGNQKVYIPVNVCVKLKEAPPIALTPEEKICKAKIVSPEGLSLEELKKKIEELCASLPAEGKQKVEDALKALLSKEEKCDEGTTGKGASIKYGFDKLSFTWNPEKIDGQFCYGSFCDAAQNSIASVKKLEEIKKFISGKETELTAACEKEKTFLPIGGTIHIESTACNNKDAANLYRFAVSQARVVDKITANELVFFTGEDGIIEGSKIDSSDEYIKTMASNVLKFDTMANVIESTQNILNVLKDKTGGKTDSIVMEINYNDATKQYYASHFVPLGIEDLQGFTQKKYVMTFNEFSAFHKALKAVIDGKIACNSTTTTNCYSPDKKNYYISGLTAPVTAEFLRSLYNNLSFKNGIRNAPELSSEEIQTILKEGKLKVTTSEINSIDKFEKMYKENIDSNVLLMKDSYTNDFKEDFLISYSKIGTEKLDQFDSDWSFILGNNMQASVEAGRYEQVINYNWETKKVSVKLTQQENLEQMDKRTGNSYKDNYFFSLPFDGKLGLVNTTYSRDGYGVGYGTLNASFYVNKDEGNVNTYNVTAEKTTGSSNGLMKFNADLRQKFEQTRNGTVLSVDGTAGKFEFTPSTPIIVSAELNASTAEKRGMLYELEMNSKELGIADETNLTNIFSWTSCSGSPKNDSKTKMNALESKAGTVEHYGLIENPGSAITYASLSFMPSSSNYFMVYQLFKNVKNFTVFHSYNESTGKFTESVLSESSKRVGKSDVTGATIQGENIKEWVNRIEKSHVCVKPLSQGIELSWNKAKLLEEAGTQCK
ncbi:MAG: hypothetical protein AB1467_05970 [Candidatus Diapherotrites archaeon]